MEDGGEAAERQIFSRLVVEGGVTGGFFEKTGAHFAQFVHGDAELRDLGRFVAGGGEFQLWALDGTERFEFGRKAKSGGNDFRGARGLRAWTFDGGGRLSAGQTQVGRRRGYFFQRRFSRQVGRRVLDSGQRQRLSIRGPLGRRSKGRIFRLEPAKQDAAFLGVRRDQADTPWWRQKSDGRRINDLEHVKAEGVKQK